MSHAIDLIQGFFSGTFAFVVLLGLLIFVHELGHFSIARWCGVRVETFSLGFGKKIWSRKRGDTTYCLSMIPFGGYVKMFGDQPGAEISEADKSVSFLHKKVWQRMAIVLAGPMVNFFFAILVFMIVAMVGEKVPPSRLGDIESTSKAYSAGFRSGDIVQAADNIKISNLDDFSDFLNDHKGQTVRFSVLRENGETAEVTTVVEAKKNQNPAIADYEVGDIEGLQFFSKGTAIGASGNSPLAILGLLPGDRVVSINQTPVATWRQLDALVQKQAPGSTLEFAIERATEKPASSEKLTLSYVIPSTLTAVSLAALQIESAELYLSRIVPLSPADQAGLRAGDRITQINGKIIQKWEDVLTSVKSFDGQTPLKMTLLRGAETLQIEITPKMTNQTSPLGTEDKRFTIGISPFVNVYTEEPLKVSIHNPFLALWKGTKRTFETTHMMLVNLGRLVTGEISSKNIGGIISIGQAAHETFKRGLEYYLHLMAILSVNLFILNLLPVPVLDGGHLVFYTVEAIKGTPLSLKKMELAHQVGMALLLVLMVYALYNDVTRFLIPM